MKELTLIVAKGDVYDEVALTTSYTGSKMGGDPDAYERIYTTTADQAQLNRFWTESRVAVCEALRKFLDDVEEDETGLRIVLSLPSSFDDSLGEAMQEEMRSFFVMNITAKWYVFTNKGEAGQYSLDAAAHMEGLRRKACYKRRPVRPTYDLK